MPTTQKSKPEPDTSNQSQTSYHPTLVHVSARRQQRSHNHIMAFLTRNPQRCCTIVLPVTTSAHHTTQKFSDMSEDTCYTAHKTTQQHQSKREIYPHISHRSTMVHLRVQRQQRPYNRITTVLTRDPQRCCTSVLPTPHIKPYSMQHNVTQR